MEGTSKSGMESAVPAAAPSTDGVAQELKVEVKTEEPAVKTEVQEEVPVKTEEPAVKTEVAPECTDTAGPSKPEIKSEAEAAPPLKDDGPSSSSADPEDLLKEFYSDVKDVDRDNEVNRILWAFKLNPFEKLNLRFDVPLEEVKKQYRKLSLMVHPDKCKHPQASTAFDLLGDAQKQLNDEEQRNFISQVLDAAREEIRKERKKATKHDSLVRVATMLNEAGRQGVEAAWEQTEEFHEQWRVKARDFLARSEWRRRKTVKRLKDEVAKSETDLAESREKAKKQKQHDKQWEQTREDRVGGWRNFMTKRSGNPEDDEQEKAKPKKTIGELKPPKLKTNDEDKLYVSRCVTEQFRPEQTQVKQKPNQMKQPHGVPIRRPQ